MNDQILCHLMTFYGLFLISCGITAVVFIGFKAKTALISGGLSGSISLLIAYLFSQNIHGVQIAGLIFSLALFIVFSWRSAKTLFSLFAMIASSHPELKGKGIAFLIISLMAVVSLFVFGFQIVMY
jgi:hypothetical protein